LRIAKLGQADRINLGVLAGRTLFATREAIAALKTSLPSQKVAQGAALKLAACDDAVVALMLGDAGHLPAHRGALQRLLSSRAFGRAKLGSIEVSYANLDPIVSPWPDAEGQWIAKAPVVPTAVEPVGEESNAVVHRTHGGP